MATRNTRRSPARRPRTPRPATTGRRPPQQDRGQRRFDELLDAAEAVIAEVGVEATTTNAVAARAGAGMGSLYHFFPNKEAMVVALAERYANAMRPLTEYGKRPEFATMPLARMVDEIVDPLAEFMRRAPAYRHVFHATSQPGKPQLCSMNLKDSVVSHVDGLMAARAPKLSAAERRLKATVAVEMVHRMLDLAFEETGAARAAIVDDTKRLLALYSEMLQTYDDPMKRLR